MTALPCPFYISPCDLNVMGNNRFRVNGLAWNVDLGSASPHPSAAYSLRIREKVQRSPANLLEATGATLKVSNIHPERRRKLLEAAQLRPIPVYEVPTAIPPGGGQRADGA